jgi:hypothetical protein
MSTELSYTRLQVIQNWVVTPASQIEEEFASLSHETNRIPDPYIFLVGRKKLLSPSNGLPIEDSVTRDTITQNREFEAFEQIQKWAVEETHGMAIWFSPPEPYENLKIVSSEIAYTLSGEKVLFNRAIVLDVDRKTSLEIADKYPGEKITDAEDLRRSPKFLSSQDAENWTLPLSLYTDQIKLVESGEDLLIKVDTLSKTQGIVTREHAQSAGLIGRNSDSCSIFGIFFANAEKSFPCPRCHKAIPSGMGITKCPFCGVTKEEAGSTCD